MKNTVLINPSDLVGQEIKDQIGQLGGAAQRLTLLTTVADQVGTLTDIGGAAAMVGAYRPEELEGAEILFLCGPFEQCQGVLDQAPPDAQIVLVSPDTPTGAAAPGPWAVAGLPDEPSRVLVSPHPATVHLVQLLHPLADLGLARASATVVQPASLFGADALDELMEQTRQILAFHTPAGGEHFERQIVFNLLPTVDDGTVGHQVRTLLSGSISSPLDLSAQVIQGGIFHGTSVSLHVSLAPAITLDELESALFAGSLLQRVDDLPPGPVDAASTDRILVAPPRLEGHQPGTFWLWSVMDNLTRGAALNAIALGGIELPLAN